MDHLTRCLSLLFSLMTTLLLVTALPTNPEIKLDSSCSDKTYCTMKPDNYPQEIIDELLQKMMISKRQDTPSVPVYRDGANDEIVVCKTVTEVNTQDLIYQIVDENNKIRWVAQADKYFKQIVPRISCEKPGFITKDPQDREDFESLLSVSLDVNDPGYICENVLMDFSFLVLSEDMTRLELAKEGQGIPAGCALKKPE